MRNIGFFPWSTWESDYYFGNYTIGGCVELGNMGFRAAL